MPLLWSIYGAVAYRIRGGWSASFNRTLGRLLFFVPLASLIFFHALHSGLALPWGLSLGVALSAICWIGIVIGHGSYMDLNNRPDLADDEAICWLLDFFFERGKASYGRDYWGLMITGLIVTLPVGAAAIIDGHYFTGAMLAISGGIKGAAYQSGYDVANDKLAIGIQGGTEVGELFFGFCVYCAASISFHFAATAAINAIILAF